jgi:ubiquinone/menaquinone biosynthesis C-methylase UbiE
MKRDSTAILKNYVKTLITQMQYLPYDIADVLSGKRDPLTPPRRLIFVGGGDYRQIGNEFFKYFVDYCGLKPDQRVLDVGCGIARMAVPLTSYLKHGSYEGFDIVRDGIKWSSRTISTRYPYFRFQLADIYNKVYNPGGRYDASEYRFPYEDGSFDLVFLTSVATHLMPKDLEHYFEEISRVLKPHGRTLITFFLLNEEARLPMSQHRSLLDFSTQGDGYRTISASSPEHAVAFEEQYITQLYNSHGLTIVDPIRYGSWSGREKSLSFQDIVIAQKA